MACRCEPAGLPSVANKASSALFSVACSVLGGLGASSCCVVQLAFNALGLGCAGFAVLTPYEPVFKGITLAALAHLLLREGVTSRRAMLTTALSLGLMFSQDAVRFYNRGGFAPLGGVLKRPRSQQDLQQPLLARSEPYEDMLDTLRQEDQGAAGEMRSGVPGGAGAQPPGLEAAAAVSRPSAEQRTCQAGTCKDMAGIGGAATHEGDEYEYAEEGDELGSVQADTAADAEAADAGAAGDAAAPLAKGELYLRLRVEGIKCEGCAARLRAAVLALPGVRRCVVDFASKAVLLWGEAEQLGEQGGAVRSAIQHMDLSYRVALEESRRM